ncbi:MAG: D-alanine--D-alanine ligase, partial [Elusimicrobiota bacterium]|nr:D-alanine--D-alanine ligase [Elusimicrobiota bacterium]
VALKTAASIENVFSQIGLNYTRLLAEGNFSQELISQQPDLVFIAMHGGKGENGSMQGLLEVLNLPYTGSGVLASALCMDKIRSKEIFKYNGLSTPDWQELKNGDEVKLKLPVVIKPVSGGSTIATTIVRNEEDIEPAVKKVRDTKDRVIVEKYIPGREITVGVVDGKSLPVLEIISETEFYDYRAKYENGMSHHHSPRGVSEKILSRLRAEAEIAYEVTGCSGAVRADFRLAGKKGYILEINTIPGMSETSLLPEAAEIDGISFRELVVNILKSAQKKN